MKRALIVVGLLALLALVAAAPAEAQSTGVTNQEIQRFTVPGGNTTGWRVHSDGTRVNLTLPVGAITFTGVTFANLPNVQRNGTVIFCTDCTKATPCAAGGTGAFAKKLSGATWDCD